MAKWIGTGLAASIFLIIASWFLVTEKSETNLGEKLPAVSPVSVVQVHPADTRLTYETTGITLPRWPTNVVAAVSGRVESLPGHIEPGTLLTEGETLVRLMEIFYRAELENARAEVAAAELELARVKREQSVVKKDAVGAFGRKEPHVKAAEAALSAAKIALKATQQRLQDTVVVAPFPAVVVSRHVSPSQWVTDGETLFSLAASDSVDIKVELGATALQRLGDIRDELNVFVTVPSGKRWDASLRYLSPVMDPVSRQRSLVLKVINPYQSDSPLLPDQQVKVSFEGPALAQVVTAPATVMTEDGKVWTVRNDRLILEDIELLSERHQEIRFRFAREPDENRQVVRYPLSVMLEGQKVSPIAANDQGGN